METCIDFVGPYLKMNVKCAKIPPPPKLFTEEWKEHSPLYQKLLEEAIEHYGPDVEDVDLDVAIWVKLMCDASGCHMVLNEEDAV